MGHFFSVAFVKKLCGPCLPAGRFVVKDSLVATQFPMPQKPEENPQFPETLILHNYMINRQKRSRHHETPFFCGVILSKVEGRKLQQNTMNSPPQKTTHYLFTRRSPLNSREGKPDLPPTTYDSRLLKGTSPLQYP